MGMHHTGVVSASQTAGHIQLLPRGIRQATIVDNWPLVENWRPDDGTAVGLCVVAGQDAGIVEYSVDGKLFKRQDLFTQWSTWLHVPWYYVLESELRARSHTVRIRISEDKNAKSNGHACRIVYFLANGEQSL